MYVSDVMCPYQGSACRWCGRQSNADEVLGCPLSPPKPANSVQVGAFGLVERGHDVTECHARHRLTISQSAHPQAGSNGRKLTLVMLKAWVAAGRGVCTDTREEQSATEWLLLVEAA